MDRIRRFISDAWAYEPLKDSAEEADGVDQTPTARVRPESRMSRLVYGIFFFLGVSMLWAWNMFIAAAPYFYNRFQSDEWVSTHYQPSILSVWTVTNLGSVYILAKLQENASYPWRITFSLLIHSIVFTLLAFSTVVMKDVSARAYFGFVMVMVFGASLGTGINQNGVFAYVSGFGREEYTQAIMGGQGLAGVLPCIVQIFSVLAVSNGDRHAPQHLSKSAFIYFIAATGISVLALLAFLRLVKHRPHMGSMLPDETADKKSMSLWTLFQKLRFLASAVFLCFAVTMVFPVYTAEIESVNDQAKSRIYEWAVFNPLALLFWNVGDLVGRMIVLSPRLSLTRRPLMLFVFAIVRVGFIPLYQLCNIHGRGAVVQSDFFYLFFVQLLFGVTNGYVGSSCMMGASQWVFADEREAAGGFMNMMLVGGLAVGSLLSFFIAGG